ncbi:RloF protein [Ectothiorhodospira shaposhnikovii]|uniref:DUF262 domain-containing protein n=1 Tax=Ectothiorhodospira shaposhnikovii TaxID=1054 RepID=UPI001905D96F|nr:DUF262 domain-containing protein [Ectothiorhodospira shaposhnikovii]MBK1674984.1 RloF protein [Ectothiorhodospira shaposhnikovii]
MKIESHDSDIESLLDSSYFHIPRFQRPYSWEDEHVQDFWDDVVANQADDYFIGSMVVFKNSKQRFGVVDGQQRLTTITILLCVLRDAYLELGAEDLAKGVHQLVERKDRNNKNEFVLKTETSFPYFQEHIQKFKDDPDADGKSIPEELNLLSAHKKFKSLVLKVLESIEEDPSIPTERKTKSKLSRLTNIRDSIFNLNVIFVALDNEDDAYLIFETLNTRGKDLALTDLVKNHFTKHLKAKGDVDIARIKWENIQEVIHNSSEGLSSDNFIYHFWASRYEAIPQKKLFPKFKKAVTKARAKEYLNFLVNDSKLYRSLYETSYEWNKNEADVSRSLAAIQLFKLSQPIPALLSLVRAYRDKKIKYGRLRDAVCAIENFHFQFTAITSSRSSGGISAMYSSFAQRLFASSNSQEAASEIDKLKGKLRERVPSLDEFKVAFKEVYYTNANSKPKNLVRYVLRKFSEHYGFKYAVDFDDLTVEHLYPQSKIDNKWSAEIVGSFGNLIFIDGKMNEKLGDKSHGEKIKALKQEGYSLPSVMNESDEWTPDLVVKHTEEMAKVAHEEIWKI